MLATAEPPRDLDVGAVHDELVDHTHLGLIVVIIDVGTHLDLFDVLRLLRLAGLVGLFLRLVFEFADIEELRSEEHTSELQSLMRISYAVFCLKKKKKNAQRPSSCQHPTYLTQT